MSIRFADPAFQELNPRSSFSGGWPLALSGTGDSCPSFAPTICTGISTSNPQCCPNGQTCSGTDITTYCCPSTGDCGTYVATFPACANSTWNMFAWTDTSKFFCCEPGQIGVFPADGYDGICEPANQVVPASMSATLQSQIGAATGAGAATSAGGNSPTTTGSSTSPTGSTGSQSGSSPNSSGTNAATTKSSSSPLGTGPIIGIVIGGLGLILLAGIFWALLRRRRPAPQPVYHQAPVSESPLPPAASKPVASVSDRQVYAGGPGFGPPKSNNQPQPPQYSNPPEHYVPPPTSDYGAPPTSTTYNSPQSGFASPYSEMEDSHHPRVAELRGNGD